MHPFDAVALVIAAAGVAAVLVAGAAGGRWREGAQMALLLWTAAGLLRLAVLPDWQRLGVSAAIIVVRQIVSCGLRAGPGLFSAR